MEPTNNIHENVNGEDRSLKEIFGKSMPYEVPNGYFERLPGRTLESVRQKPVRALLLQGSFSIFAAAAAVFIMAALVITMVFSEKDSQINSLEEYSLSDIYRYNINNLADFEEIYLLSIIEDGSLDTKGLFEVETGSISDEVIMEYLLAENHIEYHIINEY